MTLLFTALMLLCGLGATILATTAQTKWQAAVMAVAFGAAAVFAGVTGMLPDPVWTGAAVAFVAALRVFKPRWGFLSPACAGALAGIWTALLETQGVPAVAAFQIAGVTLLVPSLCAARIPGFAPDGIREEALLIAAGLGLAVAMIPEISSGWHSALVLNREEQNSANQVIANWVLVLSAASLALGGLYSLLRRR